MHQLRAAFHHSGLCVAPESLRNEVKRFDPFESVFTPAKVDVNALNVQPMTDGRGGGGKNGAFVIWMMQAE